MQTGSFISVSAPHFPSYTNCSLLNLCVVHPAASWLEWNPISWKAIQGSGPPYTCIVQANISPASLCVPLASAPPLQSGRTRSLITASDTGKETRLKINQSKVVFFIYIKVNSWAPQHVGRIRAEFYCFPSEAPEQERDKTHPRFFLLFFLPKNPSSISAFLVTVFLPVIYFYFYLWRCDASDTGLWLLSTFTPVS